MGLTTTEKRKAVYQYYRSLKDSKGNHKFTASEARVKRGRWRSVWYDYQQEVENIHRKNSSRKLPRPPALDYQEHIRYDRYKELKNLGVPTKIAKRWENLKSPGLLEFRLENLKRYWKAMEEATGMPAADLRKMQGQILSGVDSQNEMYTAIQESYNSIVGFSIISQ